MGLQTFPHLAGRADGHADSEGQRVLVTSGCEVAGAAEGPAAGPTVLCVWHVPTIFRHTQPRFLASGRADGHADSEGQRVGQILDKL